MIFRIELYKEGWTHKQIEHYIYKYLLKDECNNTNPMLIEIMYHNLIEKVKIYNKYKIQKIGRPSIPQPLKQYIKNKTLKKIKDNMRLKYKYSKCYEDIKYNLLTLEEKEYIIGKIGDRKDIVNKLNNLVLKN